MKSDLFRNEVLLVVLVIALPILVGLLVAIVFAFLDLRPPAS